MILEDGKKYIRFDGVVVTISLLKESSMFPFYDQFGRAYMDNGRTNAHPDTTYMMEGIQGEAL